MQDLGSEHKDLIFEFANWILEENQTEGLKIFTEDIQEVENMPRADVLDYLLKKHTSLVIDYLEHIIEIWNEPKPLFHNTLIKKYRDKISECKTDMEVNKNTQKQSAMEATRAKLITFLKTSDKYHADKILVDFPYNDLFEERAIILGKLKKHEKVLAIYIQILGDLEKSIEYCGTVYEENDVKDQEAYIILIR